MDGYIKIFRQIKDWQHFQEPSVVLLFIDLLISANFKRGYFHGIAVGKGSLITSYRKLSEETGLSVNTIKVCISKLVKSGEISIKTTKGQFTYIAINQFNKYQGVSIIDTPTDTPTDTLIDTPVDTPTDTLIDTPVDTPTDYNRRKKRNIRREEYILESGEINSPAPSNKPTLEERENNFYNEVAQFVGKYNREMLRAFFDYWSEPNKQKNKMRFELQKTWDTGRRLSTWAKREENTMSNNQNFKSNGTRQQKGLTDEEILSAVAGGFALHSANKPTNN